MTEIVIPLTRGLVTVVDALDAPLAAHKWCAHRGSHGSVYAVRQANPLFLRMHRVILNAPRGMLVDHINGDTLDNRRANLRITDHAGNARNTRSSKNQKRGGFKGVGWSKSRGVWIARIGLARTSAGSQTQYLGGFADALDAARAYNVAALHHFGEHAALNLIPGDP